MRIEEWLKTDLGQKIWNNKYRYNGETLDAWFKRVSGGEEELESLIKEQKFLFGGRTLSNIGLKDGSLSNCYSNGYVEDNLPSIMKTNTDLALTYKAQGAKDYLYLKLDLKVQ